MGLLMVLFVVFMVMAVAGGWYVNRENMPVFGGYFLLWLSVAVLGVVVFAGRSGHTIVL